MKTEKEDPFPHPLILSAPIPEILESWAVEGYPEEACGLILGRRNGTKIEAELGVRPPFALEAFSDAEDDVRQSIARIETSPYILCKNKVRGFVFDVQTGKLEEVEPNRWVAV